ncbi:response regulator [Paenibacillus sp. JX-17]|uniref:Response regulator n=1 Tax=Paenibacillus lacisoli TaxID=3064525 RepID=A0ABT9CIZ9_9BACL|nr:response regulator [Paenibacillus sp. JX-17]MDO7907917.1 response regulator [Paenibacillus sp. JX-17]
MYSILLVDDESYVTESLKLTMDWEQLQIQEVYQAKSALEALDVLEENEIDIIVTDIRMPEMTGLELIEIVSGRWPGVKCLLLTGYSDFQYAQKAIQLQAHDYILKPVDDEEFAKSVGMAIESLQAEREQEEKFNQLRYSRRSDLAILHSNFMRDLLLGRQWSTARISEKLQEYEVNLQTDRPTVLTLIQLGRSFTAMDAHSVSLMEYAIGNIAEEFFQPQLRIWSAKAPHDCLVLLSQSQQGAVISSLEDSGGRVPGRAKLEPMIEQFQQQVNSYLKGEISLIISKPFLFPDGLAEAYRAALGHLYLPDHEGAGTLYFMEDEPRPAQAAAKPLDALYKPPTLIHLLESQQWQTAGEKLNQVFDDIIEQRLSREHLYQTFLAITNAFIYIAHHRGLNIADLDPAATDPLNAQHVVQSVRSLREWTMSMLQKLPQGSQGEEGGARSHIVKQVQQMIAADNGYELSVKIIADQVFLHPVYLSKIYKAETGEGLGDYLIRKRMETALYLLKNSNKKIYEITSELGYQNPQYFSKMFRKHYGMTPHEFREQS